MSFTIMSGRSMHFVLVGIACLVIASSTCCSSVGSSNNIMCLESERTALLQFKQGLVDDSNVLASWESNKDCCKWRGIACNNQTGHVITLNLRLSSSYDYYEIHLSGEIDSSLLELRYLNYLDLSFNDFGGMMIPKFIGSLSQLKELKLAHANFSGPIPPQLGNLSNLHTLDLSNFYTMDSFRNSVSFENLEWLSHLSSLRYLNMSRLDFSEVVNWPQSLSKLTSLIELQLIDCSLPDVNLRSLSSINSSTSLQVIDLSENSLNSSILYWIANVSNNFVDIDLSHNNLQGPIPDVFVNMVSLVSLDLSTNQLEGGLPKFFQNFCSLESLSLGYNQFSENVEDFVKTLSCAQNTLQSLYLSGNRFWGSWPDLTGFSKLRALVLSYNQLNGSVPESVGQLSSLEVLVLSNNSWNGVITEAHFLNLSRLHYLHVSCNPLSINLSSNWNPPFQLKVLELSSCKVGPDFPKWIQRQRNLTSLYLSMNQIQGKLPNLSTSLTDLDLSFNQFSGALPSVPPKLSRLSLSNNMFSGSLSYLCATQVSYLYFLDISENLLSGELPNCLMQFRGLKILNLGKNKLSGKLPIWLGNFTELQILGLYENNFSGELPSFENCTRLVFIDVGANKLSGKIPTSIGNFTELQILGLYENNFSGELPSFENCTRLVVIDVGANKLSGKIPTSIGNFTELQILQLYENNFSGELPSFENCTKLVFIEVGANKLSGKIPTSICNFKELQILQLYENNFSGELPSFENCTRLVIIDVGANKLSGKIPTSIGQSLPNLLILRLWSNGFNGVIPFSMCRLTAIHVLDLSRNNISGALPHCFNNITSLSQDIVPFKLYIKLMWKGIEIEFGKNLNYLRSIDISSNYVEGEIPESITRMIKLNSLNLSRNKFIGKVPENFGNLKLLESLDLSRNQISGTIPASFSSLNFLEVLDVSHNQLSGRIPVSTQLQSFNASAYVGNSGLCGPPLTQNCSGDGTTQDDEINESDSKEEDNDGLKSMGFIISTVLGFVTGFWIVCGSLLLKSSWRYAYFKFLDDSKDWVYVKTVVCKAKMQR